MNKDLGLDAATYGMAAGAFFWGYFLLEVPSNIILEKLGARIWIARIMVTWGLLSGATAFCTGPWSFLTMRFLLGLAEAGLFPGMILFFTYWFPDWHRARIVSGFMVALPLAVAAGAPMSTALLELNGLWGLAGWKWMFIAEAIPTVLVGIFLLFCVTDRPHLAHWLGEDERSWLISTLETERRLVEAKRKVSVWESFWNPKVLWLTLNYLGVVTASLGMLLFLPQIIKQLGDDDPVSLRRHRHAGLGLGVGSARRPALDAVLRLFGLGCRSRDRRPGSRCRLGIGGHVDRRNGVLRLQGPVLVYPLNDPDRRIRHRVDQFVAISAASSGRPWWAGR